MHMPLEKSRYDAFAMMDQDSNDYFSLYELFHENSKLDPDVSVPDFKRIAEIRNNPAYIAVMSKAFKQYPGLPSISLPLDVELGEANIGDVIRMRRTVRNFTGEPISLEQFSAVLLYSYGITGQFTYNLQRPEIQYLRAAPSGGGLYPIEVYPVVLHVDGVAPGIYHYNVKDHALTELEKGNFHDIIPPLLSGQSFTKKCAAIFLLTAMFKRTTRKYGQRGYRFVLLDAGHIGQNFYLAATAMALGCLAIGGAYDRQVEEILRLDGVEESLVYVLAVGHASLDKPYVPPASDDEWQ